jgi:hypothetical protein
MIVDGSKWGWKLYLWIMAALFLGSIPLAVQSGYVFDLMDLADYGTWFMTLVGVYGLAYAKGILHKRIWRYWLPIVLVWDFGSQARGYLLDPASMDDRLVLYIVATGVVVALPGYVALYLYGYRSDGLWAGPRTENERPG